MCDDIRFWPDMVFFLPSHPMHGGQPALPFPVRKTKQKLLRYSEELVYLCGKTGNQNAMRFAIYSATSSILMRSCSILSRSRTVTQPSCSVSKSTVTQNGVPISSSRR